MTSPEPYPRPDFVRSNLTWLSLNGPWSFIFDDTDIGLSSCWHLTGVPDSAGPHSKQPINVPYVFQCPASGINVRGVHEVLWYERLVPDIRTADQKEKGYRLLLRFGAVDYDATVWADGKLVGGHRGGHVPFDVDLTDVLFGKSEDEQVRVTIRVKDSAMDKAQPRGKQYWKPESAEIWYTPSSGIWQSVWLESVPPVRIGDGSAGTVLQSHDIASGELRAEAIAITGRRAGTPYTVEIEASLAGVPVSSTKASVLTERDYAALTVPLRLTAAQREQLPSSYTAKSPISDPAAWKSDGLALWSPAYPQLYTLVIRLFDGDGNTLDEITTETGMRSLSWTTGDATFRLNGNPIFQALILDQGYWADTLMTPPSQDALKADIELAIAMGFNGCRKHQKVEDPVFLYWADHLGYLVWGEMANAYEFDAGATRMFQQEWRESMMRDVNHPSIVTWTPLNENWGVPNLKDSVVQRDYLRTLYWESKLLDPTRPINENDGWEHVQTDLATFHYYKDWELLRKWCSTLEGIVACTDFPYSKPLYSPPIEGKDPGATHLPGVPIMCTEFGGLNIKPQEGEKTGDKDWGYLTASDSDDLVTWIEKLVRALVDGGHVCALVYTQLTDVEQEVNGLYTIDRKPKADPAKMKAMMDKAQQAYYDLIKQKGVE